MLSFILAAIGTLGIGGFIAVAVFAPSVAAQIAKVAFGLFDRLVSTRWGVGLLVAIVCLVFGNFYFDHRGAARVQAKWDAAKVEYAAALDTLRSDAQSQAAVAVEAAAQAEREKTTAAEQRIADYERKLATQPGAACTPISDDDLAAADGGAVQPHGRRRNWLPFHRGP